MNVQGEALPAALPALMAPAGCRILSISAQKPHSTGSGVCLTELVRAFADAGIPQAVIAGVYADDVVDFPDDVRFYPVTFQSDALPFAICGMSDEMPYPSTRYRDMTPVMVLRFRQAFSEAIRRVVDEFQPTLILVHHLYLVAAIAREVVPDIPIFGLCHGTCLRQVRTNPLCRDEILKEIPLLDHLFCQTEGLRSQVCATFGVPEARVSVYGSGYNARIFHREGEVPPHQGKLLVYAGKLARKKGVISLLHALNRLDYPPGELNLVMAGGSNSRDEEDIARAAEECRYPVRCPGMLSQQELARLLNQADAFVLPSFYEGMPLVLVEAMACGCRCVCTDLPGVRDWMNDAVPGNDIRFVPMPAMVSIDMPDEMALPTFEDALAGAIQAVFEDTSLFAPDLSGLSWDAVAARILRQL